MYSSPRESSIDAYKKVFFTSYGCMRLYVVVCDCMWLYVIVGDYMWLYVAVCGCMSLYVVVSDCMMSVLMHYIHPHTPAYIHKQ